MNHNFGRVQRSVHPPFISSIAGKSLRHVYLSGLFWALSFAVHAAASTDPFDKEEALRQSQAAIGRQVADYRFLDENGQTVSLSDYRGRPVLISLIYTSCFHTCPMTTQNLKKAVRAARETLKGKPFQVLTIGFDAPVDNPQSMAGFHSTQAVRDQDWAFLSSDKDTIEALTRDLGFAYYPTPRGYDHLVQLSVLDDQGVLYQQVYGQSFELPWLVEPLKEIIYAEQRGIGQLLSNIGNRVRLFCTLYDPVSGRYRFDISLFIQMAIGAMIILTGIIYLVRELRRAHRLKVSKHH